MSDKQVIDVRTVPGPQRHPLIFHTFDTLRIGESLQIVNDHNPAPLHNQFDFQLKGHFTWEYLEEGPAIWRVRISKVAKAAPGASCDRVRLNWFRLMEYNSPSPFSPAAGIAYIAPGLPGIATQPQKSGN